MQADHSHSLDLRAIARQAMIVEGFVPDLPTAAADELRRLRPVTDLSSNGSVRDLRGLHWSSIDNQRSRDLDQVEVVEQLPGGAIRVSVGIADVDALVSRNGAINLHAEVNGTSVYTGFQTFG